MAGQQSYGGWLMSALGVKFGILLFLSAILSFVLTLVVVRRGKAPMAGVALLFIVPLPVLISIFSVIDGNLAAFVVMAASDNVPTAQEWAQGTAMSLASLMVGMLLMAPSYLLAIFGLLSRSLSAEADGLKRS